MIEHGGKVIGNLEVTGDLQVPIGEYVRLAHHKELVVSGDTAGISEGMNMFSVLVALGVIKRGT